MELQTLVDDEHCVISNGRYLTPFVGMRILNFLNPAVYHFKNQKRKPGGVTEFIQHETVSTNWKGTVATLSPKTLKNPNGRNLGVHFIIDYDGSIYQHGDIETDILWHAGPHSNMSVGTELVNPYYPAYIPKKNSPWTTVIDAPWADKGKYVVPTIQSLEANFLLTEWLISEHSGLKIPRIWHSIVGDTFDMDRITRGEKPSPGVYSHTNFAHADGSFPSLYNWLRGERGLDSQNALAETLRAATGAKKPVDLSYYSPSAGT